ncbi:MAG TPA: ABC transporter ATP-binding protein [Bdellovibrionota bacterium]|nr:ABC transporter ATP-binding protein [Bdellovibrionota bacterium]
MIAIQAEGLHKTYDQAGTPVEVLKGLDLEVKAGETVAILGQSGSGKSTLLSLLAGLDAPTRGTVRLAERPIVGMSEAELARFRARHLGIVFQQFHLMSYLSALENVRLPLEIARMPEASPGSRELLEKVGLAHRLDHLPSQLSGGEKQRVAIARAMIARPSCLLADEPSGNLDRRTGEEVMDLLFEQVRTSGMAMVLVTHNEALASRCDRKLALRDGRLA